MITLVSTSSSKVIKLTNLAFERLMTFAPNFAKMKKVAICENELKVSKVCFGFVLKTCEHTFFFEFINNENYYEIR